MLMVLPMKLMVGCPDLSRLLASMGGNACSILSFPVTWARILSKVEGVGAWPEGLLDAYML